MVIHQKYDYDSIGDKNNPTFIDTTKDITFTLRLLLGEDEFNALGSAQILLDDVSVMPVIDNTVEEFEETNLFKGSSFETDDDVAKWTKRSYKI